MGYVPQNSQLLEGTIAENIARFRLPLDEKEILEAARMGHAHEAIKATGGYDRQVGFNGSFLPGGLRQRIALARALYGNPVLLILDEPSASLDLKGLEDLLKAISDMKRRKQTVVVIDHHPMMERIADKILLLEHGQQKKMHARRSKMRPAREEGNA